MKTSPATHRSMSAPAAMISQPSQRGTTRAGRSSRVSAPSIRSVRIVSGGWTAWADSVEWATGRSGTGFSARSDRSSGRRGVWAISLYLASVRGIEGVRGEILGPQPVSLEVEVRRFGVEEELLLVDPGSGAAVALAELVTRGAEDTPESELQRQQ